MNIVIDTGNTRTKIGVFNSNQLIHNEVIKEEESIENTLHIIEKYDCKNGIISCVGKSKKNLIEVLSKRINLIEMSHLLKIPFHNLYETPQTLGVDRIALVAGACQELPNKNVLVIDVGTCITYDFINANNEYLGGGISPGIEMRYKALHHFTAKLPLLTQNDNSTLIGTTTHSSIHSGVINGVVNEIDGIIDQYNADFENLTVILTGGSGFFLAKRIKNTIFAKSFLLLKGLNKILTYNL
ncbi:MAG: type III pantothenate kinase [Flavobacteriaceae bacterium]|nr:type III pantothenate kinase [Flavobacteriaceae bacterium]